MGNLWPRVVADEPSGVFLVHDPRVFRVGRADFCRRWLNAAARRPGVRGARVDLATATVRVEFDPGATSTDAMSSAFSDAVRGALDQPPDDRPGASNWVALAAYPGSDPAPVWEVLDRSARRLRVRHAGLQANPGRRKVWLDRLAEAVGVVDCRVRRFSQDLTITFDPSLTHEDRLLDAAQAAWASTLAPKPARGASSHQNLPASRWDRRVNLFKAGSAFALTLAGLAVPGIPTVPFLFATSYYLAKASPRLNRRLQNSAFFGPILRDWEQYHGLSGSSKLKLIGLTVSIVVATVIVSPLHPAFVVLIVFITAVGAFEIARLPGTPQTELPKPSTRSDLALSAP